MATRLGFAAEWTKSFFIADVPTPSGGRIRCFAELMLTIRPELDDTPTDEDPVAVLEGQADMLRDRLRVAMKAASPITLRGLRFDVSDEPR